MEHLRAVLRLPRQGFMMNPKKCTVCVSGMGTQTVHSGMGPNGYRAGASPN